MKDWLFKILKLHLKVSNESVKPQVGNICILRKKIGERLNCNPVYDEPFRSTLIDIKEDFYIFRRNEDNAELIIPKVQNNCKNEYEIEFTNELSSLLKSNYTPTGYKQYNK